MQKIFIKLLLISLSVVLQADTSKLFGAEFKDMHRLNWSTAGSGLRAFAGKYQVPVLNNGVMKDTADFGLPFFIYKRPLNNINILNVAIRVVNERNNAGIVLPQNSVSENYRLSWYVTTEKKVSYINIMVLPMRNSFGQYTLIDQFETIITYNNTAPTMAQQQKTGYATESVLATGTWLKYYIRQTGVQRITAAMLRQQGIDPASIDPRTIKIYGNGPGMLPKPNSEFRIDDLRENAIVITGESDGRFDEGDEIFFYGKSQQDVWVYDSVTNTYAHSLNIFTDETAYFLTFGGSPGKRIATIGPVTSTRTTQSYDQLYYHERENTNLIRSGQRFMGEEFGRTLTHSFTVNMGNVIAEDGIFVRSSVAARSFIASSLRMNINGQLAIQHNIPAVGSIYFARFASDADGLKTTTIPSATSTVNVSYTYQQSAPSSIAWLDYFELQTRNRLQFGNGQFLIRDKESVRNGGVTRYEISTSATDMNVWDVTVPGLVNRLTIENTGSGIAFSALGDTLRQFIVFNGDYITPTFAGRVNNQNLHGKPIPDLVIVTPEIFWGEATRLANHHQTVSGLKVLMVTPDQIYNEFSSGVADITAIRDMMRMFYKRASQPSELPKALLMFGRASYDYKNRIRNNTNFAPTYQSWESFDPVRTYCSDDFYGLLDDNEGMWDSPIDFGWNGVKESIDIAIGRFPANDPTHAAILVNKTIQYQTNPEWGDWMNRMVFVADDEDFGIHESQANSLADYARNNFKYHNVQKIFIDAYPEVAVAGGVRNPQANADIVRSLERGCLIFNYTGHGGEVGLASERIFMVEDINRLSNGGRLSLMITATCEFSRFDDPERVAAGELTLLNPNGGSAALFTTVRLVNSGSNFALNNFLLQRIGLDSIALYQAPKMLGEIMRLTKNDYSWSDKNERNFTLLGDPCMYLVVPQKRIQIQTVNQKSIASGEADTLKAFSKVTITGIVTELNGSPITNFAGEIFPTVFDKVSTYTTIRNNPESYSAAPFSFQMQNNVIHRGRASVTNGAFTFSFIVPKDISYEFGFGRITCFGNNNSVAAMGYNNSIVVGGTADSIANDNMGPNVRIFMNDEKFANGGLTNQDPMLIAKLRDDNGINITGRGIGRDITAVLNKQHNDAIVLNDFYQSKLDSYQEGEVRYRMKSLEAGKYTLTVGAWDAFNNYGENNIEFVVATDDNLALKHVLNYPNPFTTFTTFHFDHNKPGVPIQVMIQIYTIGGKLIKTLRTETVTAGNHFDQLNWDGRDEYGDALAKGVYIYKVRLKSQDGKSADEFQKLVILN